MGDLLLALPPSLESPMSARWSPKPIWEGEDAYVIGGGTSLETFDWSLIRGRRTVGCNGAYLLGADICNVLVFGDYHWWTNIGQNRLHEYGGICVACVPSLEPKGVKTPPWVLHMNRKDNGIGTGDTLAWNCNTGSLALNLALLLGARRVFLLGFDMGLGEGGKINWHNDRYQGGSSGSYHRFSRGLRDLALELPRAFPGREVHNVSDVSKLEVFPRVSLATHFGGVLCTSSR